MPEGVTIEQCVEVTPETSDHILSRELTPVDGFPIPHAGDAHPHDGGKEDWEFSRRLLLAALGQGGKLFFVRHRDAYQSSEGYAVVREGRVVASMTTCFTLSDPPH
jgi:hypothetical protein